MDKDLLERLGAIKPSGSYCDSVMEAYASLPEGQFFEDLEMVVSLLTLAMQGKVTPEDLAELI